MAGKGRPSLARALSLFCFALAIACLASILVTAARADMPEIKRTGGYTYVCQDPEGLVEPSNHNEWPAAISACGAKAVQHGRTFRLVPGMVVEIIPTAAQEPPEEPEEPEPDPDPDPEPDPDAPLSAFQVSATGIAEPWPALAALDMARPSGRLEVAVTPEQITDGGQHYLQGDNFGLHLWRNRLHGQVFHQGERQLFRLDLDASTPLPGTEVVAGETTELTLSWSPEGLAIVAGGELRLFLEGPFDPPTGLIYGDRPEGGRPFTGEIAVEIYAEPLELDRCENVGSWATVNGQAAATPAECLVGITLEWTAPTEYTDGEPILAGELEAFRIYHAGELELEVPAPADQATLANQVPGSCYRATAIAKGLESDPSNEACK